MPTNGPFLSAALVCEKVLQEQNGVVSAIRIIDRVFFVTDADGRPLNPQYPLVFLIALKSGAALGRYSVEVVREMPSGERSGAFTAPVYFEGQDRGVNLILNAVFEAEQEGLYWFDVYFADPNPDVEPELLTRIPLRAVFQPMPTVGPPSSRMTCESESAYAAGGDCSNW